MKSDLKPFFFLTLDLPRSRFSPIQGIQLPFPNKSLRFAGKIQWRQFNLQTEHGLRLFHQKYPKYLILHLNRFVKNNFVVEHNPTIVHSLQIGFPSQWTRMKCLMGRFIICSLTFTALSPTTRIKTRNHSEFSWNALLQVNGWISRIYRSKETQAQMLFMSESYIQIWGITIKFKFKFKFKVQILHSLKFNTTCTDMDGNDDQIRQIVSQYLKKINPEMSEMISDNVSGLFSSQKLKEIVVKGRWDELIGKLNISKK